jgi:hypothetical protein
MADESLSCEGLTNAPTFQPLREEREQNISHITTSKQQDISVDFWRVKLSEIDSRCVSDGVEVDQSLNVERIGHFHLVAANWGWVDGG